MYSKTLKKDCSYSYTVPCGHGKECMHSVWLLQHCNIWGMADPSQNLYSFASNTTGHLKGVSYHALIPLNKILLQNRWCFSLSFSLEFKYCFVAGVFCQFAISFDRPKVHVKVFRPHLNHILLGGGPFWFRTICVCVCCLMSYQDLLNC